MKLHPIVGLGLLVLASCTSTYRTQDYFYDRALKTYETSDGARVEYTLLSGRERVPTLHRTTTRTLEVARIGVDVLAVDSEIAEAQGVPAWEGVYVSSVRADSAARRAGLRRGDVVRSIAGQAVSHRDQFTELVESLTPGEPVPLELARREADGLQRITVDVVPEALEIDESRTDQFALDVPAEVTARTGMRLATVPANLAQEIWGTSEPTVVVASVIAGSPAYLSGLRGGDVVRAVGGVVPTSEGLEAQFAGPEPIAVAVAGPLGEHEARLKPVKDVYEESAFHIPFVLNRSAYVDNSWTSFLDVIFQFGFNHRKRYVASATREPAVKSDLSILPLGMFEFEREPGRAENTIFWFIRWSSSTRR